MGSRTLREPQIRPWRQTNRLVPAYQMLAMHQSRLDVRHVQDQSGGPVAHKKDHRHELQSHRRGSRPRKQKRRRRRETQQPPAPGPKTPKEKSCQRRRWTRVGISVARRGGGKEASSQIDSSAMSVASSGGAGGSDRSRSRDLITFVYRIRTYYQAGKSCDFILGPISPGSRSVYLRQYGRGRKVENVRLLCHAPRNLEMRVIPVRKRGLKADQAGRVSRSKPFR